MSHQMIQPKLVAIKSINYTVINNYQLLHNG